jgi:hypothetical protein
MEKNGNSSQRSHDKAWNSLHVSIQPQPHGLQEDVGRMDVISFVVGMTKAARESRKLWAGRDCYNFVSASNWIAVQFIMWSLGAWIHADNRRSRFEYQHVFRLLSRAVLSRDFWVRSKEMSVIANKCANVNADWIYFCKISDLNNKWPDYLNFQEKRDVRLDVVTDVAMYIAVSCDKTLCRFVLVASILPTLRRVS